MGKRKICLIFLMVFMLLVCGIEIYAGTSLSVSNPFETGIVKISLKEYEKDGMQEKEWKDQKVLLPADKVSKIPRIKNEGCSCYVRAKLLFRELDGIGAQHLFGISKDWMLADDGYYYYTEILENGENVEIFQGLDIPKDLSKIYEGKTFYLDIDVDAIQSKNFTPQFEAATPWGAVEILRTKEVDGYDLCEYQPAKKNNFQILYEKESEKLIANSRNFFEYFPYLMPGDHYSERIEISNQNKEEVQLYFKSIASENCELSKKIQLKITCGTENQPKVVYEGALSESEMSKEVLLGKISKNQKMYFDFEIAVPREMNNKYTLLNNEVIWIFSTEPIENVSYEMVKTGDFNHVEAYIVGGIFLPVIMVCCFYQFKKKKRKIHHEP